MLLGCIGCIYDYCYCYERYRRLIFVVALYSGDTFPFYNAARRTTTDLCPCNSRLFTASTHLRAKGRWHVERTGRICNRVVWRICRIRVKLRVICVQRLSFLFLQFSIGFRHARSSRTLEPQSRLQNVLYRCPPVWLPNQTVSLIFGPILSADGLRVKRPPISLLGADGDGSRVSFYSMLFC